VLLGVFRWDEKPTWVRNEVPQLSFPGVPVCLPYQDRREQRI
jgi:hypothetical protein